MQRVAPHEAIDFSGIAGRILLECPDGSEFICYWLRTWIHRMAYQHVMLRDEWSQCVLFWHGRDGLRVLWLPVEHL